jgi:membrane protease YdiL (CAAX protease family)
MMAVLLSAVIFSIVHGYQGLAGVITVVAIGPTLAVIYLWRGTLTAPIVMLFLQILVGIFLAPGR